MATTAPPEPVYFESGHTDQVSVTSSHRIYRLIAFLVGNTNERQTMSAGT